VDHVALPADVRTRLLEAIPDPLAVAELDAGRRVPPGVIAACRRAAVMHCRPDLVRMAARCTDPVLNVGEQWASKGSARTSSTGSAAPLHTTVSTRSR